MEKNNFDKFFAEKLDQREFQFNPAHWEAAEKLIDLQEASTVRRRRKGWWLLLIPLLALLAYLCFNGKIDSSSTMTQSGMMNTAIPQSDNLNTSSTDLSDTDTSTNTNTTKNSITNTPQPETQTIEQQTTSTATTPISNSISKGTETTQSNTPAIKRIPENTNRPATNSTDNIPPASDYRTLQPTKLHPLPQLT